jgi:type I restriction enzyme M protein
VLGGLIDIFSNQDLAAKEHESLDVLGRVFEYMLSKFASAEGKLGGEFFTPRNVVELMVEMLEPLNGRVYDPACGSGGMFVQTDSFVKAHGGVRDDVSVFGQEQNPTTWRLAKMNLALRGIEANLGSQWGDSFTQDLHPDLRADFVIANPPFNIKNWGAEKLSSDARWRYGTPPAGNANFAWVQHMLHHLAPHGTMATILSNGSLSSKLSGEGDIRRKLIEEDLVECIVSLPGQLFYTTQIPVCIWFLVKDKTARTTATRKQRDRTGEVLFIDAHRLGTMTSRTLKELSIEDITKIAETFHSWRAETIDSDYMDIPGFNASVSLDTIASRDFVLTPGRYVGEPPVSADVEPIGIRIERLTRELRQSFEKRSELSERVLSALDSLEEK